MANETAQLDEVGAEEAAESVLCAHCRLLVPAGLVEPGATEQFCCHGCRAAYAVIHACGLEGYYRLMERMGDRATARDAEPSGDYAEFDDPAFAALYCRPATGNLRAVELVLEGMHCAACVWLLERLERVVPGVVSARVSLARRTVEVVYDPGAVRLSRIGGALATLGYRPHAARENAARAAQRLDERKQLVRLAVAGACAGNVMLMAFALYGGLFGGNLTPALEAGFRWLSLGTGLVCMAWPGRDLFRGAWNSVRYRTASIDAPIALAVLAGGVMGTVNTVLNRGEIYFDSLTMLIFLLLVGRYLGGRQQRAAADSVELLFSLTSGAASRVEADGAVRRVPLEVVRSGDVVEVLPGQSVPVDGVVVSGSSAVDQSLLTGESRPVRTATGDSVLAACVNLESPLRVRATATGRDTRAGRLMALVETAAQRRPGVVRFADSIARPFTLVVLAVAAVTAAAWWTVAGPARAVDNAVSLLIVTCPCALGVAAPLAVGVAIGRAARRGMLVKGGDVFERLARPGTILLDKTGTLTQGRMSVVRTFGDAWVLELASALERNATHPIARAIARDVPGSADPEAQGRQSDRGGIRGRVAGREVAVGNEAFIRSLNGSEPGAGVERFLAGCRAEGLSAVLVAVDGQPCAAVALGDAVRPEAAACVAALRSRGWEVGMLTGDEPAVAARVGAALGIEPSAIRAGVMPEEKARIVRGLGARGRVVMVGDGVNDAAALAEATVGIAVHGGAEASLSAADVYLAREGLKPVVELLEAGPRVLGTVRRIFVVSTSYNVLAGALAVAGVIHPIVAAILMPISSLSVISVALRSRTFGAGSPGTGGERWT
ncbi:MAG: heavy metal translocating P-type ATPase [Phycisphaeraceae bacterium]|nr:heavy metal translocating P-type ATPase [Phycisphaeraceae bacterium]